MRQVSRLCAAGWLRYGVVAVCLTMASGLMACPAQTGRQPTGDMEPHPPGNRSKTGAGQSVKTPVLVRNTNTAPAVDRPVTAATTGVSKKAEPAPTATKSTATHDKKTISRCWKRLMDMARDVRHKSKTD